MLEDNSTNQINQIRIKCLKNIMYKYKINIKININKYKIYMKN